MPVSGLVRRLDRAVRREIDARLEDSGLAGITAAHVRVLGSLGARGARVTDLAPVLGVSKQAVTKLVDHLVASGYAERFADPDDARAKLVCPTAQGDEAVRITTGQIRSIERRWRATVGEEHYRVLQRALAELLASS